MLNVETNVVNNPEFIELQYLTLKRFMKGSYVFKVYNDAKKFNDFTNFGDTEIYNKIKRKCANLNIQCIDIPNDHHKRQTSAVIRCSDSNNFMLNNYHKLGSSKFLVLDSDMFLIKEIQTSIYDDYMCAIVPQTRGKIKYFWNGLYYFDFNKIPNRDIMKWDYLIKGSDVTDVGGHMYNWLNTLSDNEKTKVHNISHLCSLRWSKEHFPKGLHTALFDFCSNDVKNEHGKYYSELYDDTYLHLRSGGRWTIDSKNKYDFRTKLLTKKIHELIK
jgi:hypothetical protein